MKLRKIITGLILTAAMLSVTACGRLSSANRITAAKEESTENVATEENAADDKTDEATEEKGSEEKVEENEKENGSDASSDTSSSDAEPGEKPSDKVDLPKSTGTEIMENDIVAEVLEDDTAIITKFSSYDDDCDGVPGEISGHKVVAIGQNAFSYKEFEDLAIPDTVLVIEESAFSNTEIKGSLTLPDSLLLIEDKAFFAAKLPDEVKIPGNTYIGEQVFAYCEKLGTVTLGENVVLDDEAFYFSEISDLKISPSDEIGEKAFFSCSNLKTISDSGNGGNAEGIIDKQAFAYCDSIDSVEIPAYITSIAEESFTFSKIDEGISFAGKLDIGDKAFFSAEIGGTVEIQPGSTIGKQAFAYCADFEELIVGDDVSMEDEAFYYASDIKKATIGSNVMIGDDAFFSTSLEELTVGSGSEIGKEAFAYCSELNTKNIDESVEMRDDSFYYAGN